jgi:hypothetical protein
MKKRSQLFRGRVLVFGGESEFSVTFQNNLFGWIDIVPDEVEGPENHNEKQFIDKSAELPIAVILFQANVPNAGLPDSRDHVEDVQTALA